MAHRLTNIPMTIENYNEENNFIVELGRNNGYKDQEIKKIIQNNEAHQRIQNLQTHLLEPEKLSTRYMYVCTILSKNHEYFVEDFKKHHIQLTTNSSILKVI
jgi:hypothetical protein